MHSAAGPPLQSSWDALQASAFASIALHQRLPLDKITDGIRRGDLPARDMQTPGWFAAAAQQSPRLNDVAPELRGQADESPTSSSDLDLIRMYAPELQGASTDSTPPPAPVRDARNIRLDLLAELKDIDT